MSYPYPYNYGYAQAGATAYPYPYSYNYAAQGYAAATAAAPAYPAATASYPAPTAAAGFPPIIPAVSVPTSAPNAPNKGNPTPSPTPAIPSTADSEEYDENGEPINPKDYLEMYVRRSHCSRNMPNMLCACWICVEFTVYCCIVLCICCDWLCTGTVTRFTIWVRFWSPTYRTVSTSRTS